MQDVAAIVVDIAVIDPKSKVLLDNSAQVPPPNDNITVLRGQLVDYASGHPSGWLRTQWQSALDSIDPNNPDPRAACRYRPFPAFGCTNALFISLRLSNDYFAS